jgi:hypothetical protein
MTTHLQPPDGTGRAKMRVQADGAVEVKLIKAPLASDVAIDPRETS